MRHRSPLIHKQPVSIEPYDAAEQPQDALRGKTATRIAYLSAIRFDAQVEFGQHRSSQRRGQDGKASITTIGVAFIRTTDAAKKMYTPKRNDRVTFLKANILGRTLCWVSKAEPTGVSRVDYSLWKLTLTDRSPGRNSET